MPDPRSVLVVDDDRDALAFDAEILRDLGLAPATAETPGAALRLLHSQPFDALLTDLKMQTAADGFVLAAAAKLVQPHIRTLLATAALDPLAALREIEGSVDAILYKPYAPADLTQALRLVGPRPLAHVDLSTLLREHRSELLEEWRRARASDPALADLSPQDRMDHMSELLEEVLAPAPPGRGGERHGKMRRRQAISLAAAAADLVELRKQTHDLVARNYAQLDPTEITPGLRRFDTALDAEILASIQAYDGGR